MRSTHLALSRALTFCCGVGPFDVESFLHRAMWELHHSLEVDVAAMAIVIKRMDGSCFVGRSHEHHTLPAETLLGMLVEGNHSGFTCRVRDHALDTVRFLDARFRTSVLARVELPNSLESGADAALWLGSSGCAHPGLVAMAEGLAREVSEWLLWYGEIIEATQRSAAEQDRLKQQVTEMLSLLHDARAPLGVLRYLTRFEGDAEAIPSMRKELQYLEEILSQGSPRSVRSSSMSCCEVGEVLSRVRRRHDSEHERSMLTFDVEYRSFYARFPALDLERIVTNLVSNARRYAPHSQIVIRIEEGKESVVVSVRDNGPGIPRATLEALQRGDVVSPGGASGWGVGLQSCVHRARSFGGDVSILSASGEGTCVTVTLPRGEAPYEPPALEVADGGVRAQGMSQAVDVCIVDDDKEHGASLAKVLRSCGFVVQHVEGVRELLDALHEHDVVSILCDAHMPDGGAESLLPIVTALPRAPRVAIVSGDSSDEYLYHLAGLGAQAFFAKPVHIDEVVSWIQAGGGRSRGA